MVLVSSRAPPPHPPRGTWPPLPVLVLVLVVVVGEGCLGKEPSTASDARGRR